MSEAIETISRPTWGPLRNPVRGVLHGSGALITLAIAADLAARPGLPEAPRAVWVLWPLCHFALYLVSALYHSAPWGPRARSRMQRLDHCMIYVKIAGSVSALSWIALEPGALRDGVLFAAWAVAAGGSVQKLGLPAADEKASRPVQVLQACLILPAMAAFPERFPGPATWLLLAGSAVYAAGALCFLLERPRLWPRVFSFHEVFHVTTVAGSALQFTAALHYLV